MADPRELGGLLWEREAALAFEHTVEIDKAADWCRKAGPHKLEFLNKIRELLIAEDVHMAKLGLSNAIKTGAVKRTPVLTILTPSQALRLLECYKRSNTDTAAMWKAKSIDDMDKVDADARRDAVIAKIRAQIQEVKDKHA